MKQNHDVMRSDRLKQVMQEIDRTFDEKNVGASKFSKFCQEAANKGLISVRKLENGQLEVDVPGAFPSSSVDASSETPRSVEVTDERPDRNSRRRGGRGRGGRGRDRDREPRPSGEAAVSAALSSAVPSAPASAVSSSRPGDDIGSAGERLTKDEAFDLVRRTVAVLVHGDASVRASAVRERARQVLGRDSESLSERNFIRILKDAHDHDVIDLRRRGDDFEVARAETAKSVGDQLAAAEPPPAPKPAGGPPRLSLRGRGSTQGRAMTSPPELLSLGVVQTAAPEPVSGNGDEEASAKKKGGRKRSAKPAAAGAAPKKPRARGKKTAKPPAA
jgi:hypothetical protein